MNKIILWVSFCETWRRMGKGSYNYMHFGLRC